MCRITDIASLYRVVVDVVQLLPHHRLSLDPFRMASFLPELKGTVAFMSDFVILQTIKQSLDVSLSEVVDDPPCRIRLEIANLFRQVVGRGNEVDMVLQNHITQKLHAILILEILPGIEKDLNGFTSCEHRKPTDDRTG